MTQSIREVMTSNPVCLPATTALTEAASRMKKESIGDVLVMDGSNLRGLVTDRDIVIRALAEGRDPATTTLGEVCSPDLATLTPDADVDDAVRLMSSSAIRRIPIVENGTPVGIVSIGDLAQERDPQSALADISAAAPNR